MVLAERNTTDLVRNGRRSRGPSPSNGNNSLVGGGVGGVGGTAGGGATNAGSGGTGSGNNSTNASANDKSSNASTNLPGAGTPESSDDDNSTKRNGKTKAKQSEYEEKIRVGRDYQAVCPQLIPEVERRPELMNERALLVWSPTKEIPDTKLEEYISVAKEKYGYNGEQALGMLFWHKHDLERAVMDLANFTPFPDEWTVEDKVLFDQAFQFHGKSFHRIRQMLPDKSIASLVKYYYSWKKTRHRNSAMDRQEKALRAAIKDGSENGSEVGSNEESDDEKKTNNNNNNNNNNNAVNNNNNNGNGTGTGTVSSSSGNSNNGPAGNTVGENNNTNSNSNSNIDMETDSAINNNNNNNNNNSVEELVLGFGYNDVATTSAGSIAGQANGNGSGIADSDTTHRRTVVGGFCKNCNVVCHILFESPLGRMCKSCHTHWRRTGNRRPISGPEPIVPKRSIHNSAAALAAAVDRSKRKPPKGMNINHDDLTALASSKSPAEYLAEGERKIAALMAEIQRNRQIMGQLDKECESINVEDAKATIKEANAVQPRNSARWTSDEIHILQLALRDYGTNFAMIAKIVNTKTEAHVRSFYGKNRRTMNLEQPVKEYEANKKAEDANNEDSNAEASVASTAAAGASDAPQNATTAESKPTNEVGSEQANTANGNASNNSTTSQESSSSTASSLAGGKKEEAAKSTKKPESAASVSTVNKLVVETALADSSDGTTDANNMVGSTKKPAVAATITIVDESDTATNSSSDATNNPSAVVSAPANTTTVAIVTTTSSIGASAVSTTSTTNALLSISSNANNSINSTLAGELRDNENGAIKRANSVLLSSETQPSKKIALDLYAK